MENIDERMRTEPINSGSFAGKPDGREMDFWLEAERELRAGVTTRFQIEGGRDEQVDQNDPRQRSDPGSLMQS